MQMNGLCSIDKLRAAQEPCCKKTQVGIKNLIYTVSYGCYFFKKNFLAQYFGTMSRVPFKSQHNKLIV